MIKDFRKTIKKKKKNGHFRFYLTFSTTTHCNFKFSKIDPPYYTVIASRDCLAQHTDK